jgi:DNA-3-methyladenine glycosylase I
VQDRYGSLAALVWSFEPPRRGRASRPAPRHFRDVPPTTPESKALSKELLRLGYRFVGPTTMYAAMQALGITNDHLVGCYARTACTQERAALAVPTLRHG